MQANVHYLIVLNLSDTRISNSKEWILKRRLKAAKKEVFQLNLALKSNFFFTASRSTSWEPVFRATTNTPLPFWTTSNPARQDAGCGVAR